MGTEFDSHRIHHWANVNVSRNQMKKNQQRKQEKHKLKVYEHTPTHAAFDLEKKKTQITFGFDVYVCANVW